MAQHSLVVANGSRTSVRTGLQSAVQAVGNCQKGPTAPSGAQAGWLWLQDTVPSTTVWTLWQYDGAQWISLGTIDTTNNAFAPTIAGTVRLFQIAIDTPGNGNTITGGAIEKNAQGAALFLSRSQFASLYLNVNANDNVATLLRSGVPVGSISVTTTGALFNMTSDPSLKDRVSRLTGSLDRIGRVRLYRYGMKADPGGPLVHGVMAPEFRRVFPWAYTPRRRQRINGKTIVIPMGVDVSKAVPDTIGAIQDLHAIVKAQARRGLERLLKKGAGR